MKTIIYNGIELLPITIDIVFKEIFGKEENKDLLMSLLNSFLDINIHDTYYVIAHFYFALFFGLLYWIAGIIYWIFKDFRLIKSLTKIHALISIYGVAVYYIILPALPPDDPKE